MSISAYYNGTFDYERRNDEPPVDGQYSYNAPISIGAYRRKKTRVIFNSFKQNVTSNSSYATEDVELREGDKIDGHIIMALDEPDAGGIKYWRGFV